MKTLLPPPASARPVAIGRTSALLYVGLVGVTLLTHFVGEHLAGRGVPNLRRFGWDGVALVALGGLGAALAPRVGFADLLGGPVSAWQRFGRPLLVGLGFAVADVAVFRLIIHPQPLTGLTPFMQPFPYSLLLYGSGALYTDCLYRLLPIPVGMVLIGGVFLKNPRSEGLFWVLALLTSLVEPLEQLITDSPTLMAYSFGTGYAMNLAQAVFFRRFGFLAGLLVRLGHYALWHVGFGFWVQLTT